MRPLKWVMWPTELSIKYFQANGLDYVLSSEILIKKN